MRDALEVPMMVLWHEGDFWWGDILGSRAAAATTTPNLTEMRCGERGMEKYK
jgi:hypothetical protein